MTSPLKHHGRVPHAEFSPDGRRVLTASWDGTARVWDLPADDRPLADLLLLAQLLSGHRIDERTGSASMKPTACRNAWQTLHAKYPRAFEEIDAR